MFRKGKRKFDKFSLKEESKGFSELEIIVHFLALDIHFHKFKNSEKQKITTVDDNLLYLSNV